MNWQTGVPKASDSAQNANDSTPSLRTVMFAEMNGSSRLLPWGTSKNTGPNPFSADRFS